MYVFYIFKSFKLFLKIDFINYTDFHFQFVDTFEICDAYKLKRKLIVKNK